MPDTPGSLKQRLRGDLTAALLSQDEVRKATLRMALTAITNEEVSGKSARELTDDEVVVVLNREAKKRREAAEAYDLAKRAELAARERAEGSVLEEYLPAQLADDEVASIVEAAVAAAAADGATGMTAMGAVMKRVQPLVAGRADGGAVAALVRARLSAAE